MGVSSHVIISLLTLIRAFSDENNAECPSPQYINLGSVGIVECTFPEGFYGVVWYDKEKFSSSGHSFLQFIDGERNGEGYASGEFDVYPNGSLVIRNVTLQHERSFTVSIFESESDVPVSLDVKVVVTVKPSTPFPVITLCGERSNTCFRSLQPHFNVTCYIQSTRPHVLLSWVVRGTNGDKEIAFQNTITEEGHLSTSKAITSGAFSHSLLLSLLVCKADSIPGLLTETETIIFIENRNINLSALEFETTVIERGSRLKLICSANNTSMIVWKRAKERHDDEFNLLSYAAYFAKNMSRTYSEEYLLQQDGSLLIPHTEVKDEAFYGCISQTSSTSNTALFHVLVFVAAHPVVHGCTDDKSCVLKKPLQGSLTCSVTGVRPRIDLEWNTLDEEDSSVISFTDHQVTVRNVGDVYNVILTSSYQVQDKHTHEIRAECRMTSSHIGILTSSAKFALLTDYVQTTDESAQRAMFSLWVLPIIIVPVLVILILFLRLRRGRQQKQQVNENKTEENIPMICLTSSSEIPESGRIQKEQSKENITKKEVPTIAPISSTKEDQMDNKVIFLEELKTNYSVQYEAMCPIPYIRDRYYCVDDIFVEGGFERLNGNDNRAKNGKWEKINCYHKIFDKIANVSERIIIESNPGYGKSTLALKFAYDWCNSVKDSPLAGVDMLILLKLRHLSKDYSIFQAIKKFLLPRDSPLCEKAIELVMRESKSTVIILDGYDEYPDIETDSSSNIVSMIRMEMFQQSVVILTTRSFMLPKSYPPKTNRIRLTGFDEGARDLYISRAVVGDNNVVAKQIRQSLQENPVLRSLCQVPLFFVMYAHMTHDSKSTLEIKSVTSFFRYMIACFHAHLNNKMKNKDVRVLTRKQSDQDVLDEVAFDGLRTKKFVWDKDVLCTRLGEALYNHYKQLGILVEEVFDEINYAGEIRSKTEVRFFHKLFCEWYAASCLSRKVVEKDSNLPDILQQIDPIHHHYLYRFACGLNVDAAKVITTHFNKIKGADTFAILCSLEQSGDFHHTMETVRNLCSDYVAIDKNDSNLLQCSVLQLLEMGSSNQIPVPFLWLRNCFQRVDLSSQSIILNSNLTLHAMSNVREIAIVETEIVLKAECCNVLKFSSLCTGLNVLRFCCSEKPGPILKVDNYLSVLESRNVTVLWITNEDDYCLNLRDGNWEKYDPAFSEDVFKGKNSAQCSTASSSSSVAARKKLLKDLLQVKYKELVSTVPQSPNDCDKTFSVDQIFVEGVIERLISKDADNGEKVVIRGSHYHRTRTF